MAQSYPHAVEAGGTDAAMAAEKDRLLNEAERSAEQEGTIPAEEVFAWLRSLDTPNPLPPPLPRKDEVWKRMIEAREKEKASP